jgi:hypothetical protein
MIEYTGSTTGEEVVSRLADDIRDLTGSDTSLTDT